MIFIVIYEIGYLVSDQLYALHIGYFFVVPECVFWSLATEVHSGRACRQHWRDASRSTRHTLALDHSSAGHAEGKQQGSISQDVYKPLFRIDISFAFSMTFGQFGYLGWIRSGDGIQNTIRIWLFCRFDDFLKPSWRFVTNTTCNKQQCQFHIAY